MDITIGCHLSIAKGYLKASQEAKSIGANTFQFFSRNPRGGAIKKFDQKEADGWKEFLEKNEFGPVLAHAPYTLNMASSKAEVREFAHNTFKEDIERLEQLPCSLYNFHPGSHTNSGIEVGITRIADILNDVLTRDQKTTVLLETMSGKGTEIGRSFSEIAEIISRTKYNEKLGVCLDTCHVYSAGYDIKNSLDQVLEEFDKVIGLDLLKAIHLNDSKVEFQSRKDRHEKLGDGSLGKETFINIIKNHDLNNLPLYLETPNNLEGYKQEISFLKEVASEI